VVGVVVIDGRPVTVAGGTLLMVPVVPVVGWIVGRAVAPGESDESRMPVLTEVDVQVEESGACRAVVVPVEGGVDTRTDHDQDRRCRERPAHPPCQSPKAPTNPPHLYDSTGR
jgi:hypothetical protein